MLAWSFSLFFLITQYNIDPYKTRTLTPMNAPANLTLLSTFEDRASKSWRLMKSPQMLRCQQVRTSLTTESTKPLNCRKFTPKSTTNDFIITRLQPLSHFSPFLCLCVYIYKAKLKLPSIWYSYSKCWTTDRSIDGAAAVLREGGGEEGAMDAGGGHGAGVVRAGARPGQLARRAAQDGPPPLQQELPPPLDQLPPPGHPPRRLLPPRGAPHPPPPGPPRQPLGRHRLLPPPPHRQRRQELLEHPPQEEARPHLLLLLAADADDAARRQGAVGAQAADRHRPRQARPPRRPLRRRRRLPGDDQQRAARAGGGGGVRPERAQHLRDAERLGGAASGQERIVSLQPGGGDADARWRRRGARVHGRGVVGANHRLLLRRRGLQRLQLPAVVHAPRVRRRRRDGDGGRGGAAVGDRVVAAARRQRRAAAGTGRAAA